MKFHWKTPDMIAGLAAACPNATIHNTGPGGDFDTDTLIVEVQGGAIFISGYTPETEMTSPSDVEVDAITVEDGTDSRGGLHSSAPDVIEAYCNIRKMLAAKLRQTDTYVADHHDDLF